MGSTFATPDTPTECFSRVSTVNLLVGISALPSLLVVSSTFTNNRNISGDFVSVCHSCIVVAQHLVVAISTIAGIESYLIVTGLHVCECLADIKLSVYVAELSCVNVAFAIVIATIDVAVPTFSLTTNVVTGLILQHVTSLCKGTVDNERSNLHARTITCSNSSNLQGFQELNFFENNAVCQSVLVDNVSSNTIRIEF